MDDPGGRESADGETDTRDAVELEIRDLAEPHPPIGGASRRVRLLLAAGTALLLAAVLIAAAWPALGGSLAVLLAVPTPTITPLPTPLPTATPPNTPTPYPSPTPSSPTTLGPAPRDCPPGPAQQTISQAFGPAVGGTPAWVGGDFSATGNPLTLHVYDPSPAAHTLYGWSTPLLVSEDELDTRPFSLQAWNVATGDALWFTTQGDTASSNAEVNAGLFIFDPIHRVQVVGYAGGYVNWFPILYVPAPGCYVMEASWPGGAWTIPFAAGA